MKGESKTRLSHLLSLFGLPYRRSIHIRESDFQANLIEELKTIFKGCIITKLDPSYIQGIPDILILYNNKWAALECKKCANARKQPNQQYYVDLMNEMSFSRFIFPENKEEVLDDLQQAFKH